MKTIFTCLFMTICTFAIAQLETLKPSTTAKKSIAFLATEGVQTETFKFDSGAKFEFYTTDSETDLKALAKKWNAYPVAVINQERLEKRFSISNDISNLMQRYKQKHTEDSIIIVGYKRLVGQLDTISQLQTEKIDLLETKAEELTEIANRMNEMLEESNKIALKIERQLRRRNVLNNILAGVGGLGIGVLIASL